MTMEEDGPFDWSVVVPRLVHPLQVAIVEAMTWIDVPLSPSDLEQLFLEQHSIEELAYHVRRLAHIEALVQVEEQPRRGFLRKWYFLAGREWLPGVATYESAA
jgi:hypothetical protein